VSFLLRYAHDKSLDETKVFTPEDIETILFDQISKLAVQILKPEPVNSFQFAHAPWTPPGFVNPPGSRGFLDAEQCGPVPDFVEV
jgi:hypothetical protein